MGGGSGPFARRLTRMRGGASLQVAAARSYQEGRTRCKLKGGAGKLGQVDSETSCSDGDRLRADGFMRGGFRCIGEHPSDADDACLPGSPRDARPREGVGSQQTHIGRSQIAGPLALLPADTAAMTNRRGRTGRAACSETRREKGMGSPSRPPTQRPERVPSPTSGRWSGTASSAPAPASPHGDRETFRETDDRPGKKRLQFRQNEMPASDCSAGPGPDQLKPLPESEHVSEVWPGSCRGRHARYQRLHHVGPSRARTCMAREP